MRKNPWSLLTETKSVEYKSLCSGPVVFIYAVYVYIAELSIALSISVNVIKISDHIL